MEVLDANSAVLCNYEVYQLLQEIKKKPAAKGKGKDKERKRGQKHLATITYEAIKFLEETPCKHQTEEVVRSFLQAMLKFKLTKSEKLQLLNIRPTTAVEIQLIIEELEERFQEEQIEEILATVKSLLPGPAEPAAEPDEA